MNIVRIEPGSKTGAPVQRPGGDLTTSADAAARSGLTAAGLLEAVADGDTADLARQVGDAIDDGLKQAGVKLSTIQRRQLAGRWLTTLRQQSRDARRAVQDSARAAALAPTTGLKTGPVMHDITVGNSETPEDPSHAFLTDTPSESVATSPEEDRATRNRDAIDQAKRQIQPVLINRIDVGTALTLDRTELRSQIHEVVGELLVERRIQLNKAEQGQLVASLMNDLLGLGPLEPLLADDSITDIMVNGPAQIYVERAGKLVLTDVRFENNVHVMNVATRIVTAIGRRIDESSPMVDARLADGSRVNIIIPPLAIDGPSISIRKFSKKNITLDVMAHQANLSADMSTTLKIAARSGLNILISGGTGSGKTTLLNALSRLIDPGERVVTIEDAAELQLQQPHVIRLETRPPNLEGGGEITMRDLVKNALRMRPDRIILGEIRGSEAVDMLQAMNTGHDGSMCTVHANNPREAMTRLENMVGMAGINLPAQAVRTQIAAAVDLIVQVERMRDGVRRITSIVEIVGMEGDVVTTQELFTFKFTGEGADGRLTGRFDSSGLRPHFAEKASYYGLDRTLIDTVARNSPPGAPLAGGGHG